METFFAGSASLTPRCPICSTEPYHITDLPAGISLAECKHCGLLFQPIRPRGDEVAGLYSDPSYCAWGIAAPPQSVRQMKRATIDRYLHLLERNGGVGRLVDFGCGAGFLVERAIERGWDACGVDVSHVAVAEARRLVGMERIMLGKVEEVTLPQNHFDAITMFDFLEHVCEPKVTLLCAHALLRRGGLLLIITPYAGGLSHLLMGRRWSQFKVEHLQYFSRRSLTWALQHTGFEIARLSLAWKYLTLDYICRHMESYPHPLLTPVAKSLWRVSGAWLRYRLLLVPAGDMLALARRL